MVNAVKLSLLSFMLILVSACSGGVEETTSTTGISVSVQDSTGAAVNEFTTEDTATIIANLRDSNGTIIEDETILFSTTSGTLGVTSNLSDVSGQAQTSLFLSDATPGVVSITVSAVIDGETITATANIDVSVPINEFTPEQAKTNVVAQNSDGEVITTIAVGQSVTILATLTDNNDAPIEGGIVQFATSSGTLSSPSRLTNSEGTAQVILNFTSADIGVASVTASVTIDESIVTSTTNIDVTEQPVDSVDTGGETVIIGFGSLKDGVFENGDLAADDTLLVDGTTTIGAGSSFGVSVTVYNQTSDAAITSSPFEVSFTSTCVEAGKATIDATVFSIQGTASATYQDISCAGANGNEDNIVATVTIDSTQYIASRNIKLQSEALGSIEFVSASPESIVLKGVGGQGNQESSVLTFLVKGQLGNPQAQKDVNFELSTEVGGISLISAVGTTNAEGLVTATVISGNAPTAVRVTATVANGDSSISTQSDVLSVNTGLPDQNSFTIALSEFNPEANRFSGKRITVTAFLADSFNNPVPDGTTVNFTTEGGSIEPSCTTENGNCAVTWTSQEPRTDDHRVTILATAVGHEYFVDVDGNNYFNDADGSAVSGNVSAPNGDVSSGYYRITQLSSGFVDMSEAWRDDNENYQYDSGEQFIDDDNDGTFTVQDGLFNGPQCQASSCGENNLVTLRKAALLIMSGSTAYFSVENVGNSDEYFSDFSADTNLDADNSKTTFTVPTNAIIGIKFSDSAQQTLPNGTNIYINTDGEGDVPDGSATPTYTINNTVGSTDVDGFGGGWHYIETGSVATSINVGILVSTPESVTTTQQFTITVN
ncbi:MAG: Ig-like domain-containing protein [Gammaproteobacteria bacterium]|nr:Ig-like domain-containing protein [Gammaproteobacteria bacterium]